MGVQVLFSFVIYALINAFTPGPGNILALNTMTNYGWKKGKPLYFGIFAGYFFVQALCAFFIFGLDKLNKSNYECTYICGSYLYFMACL